MFTGHFKDIYIKYIKDKQVGINTIIEFGSPEIFLRTLIYSDRKEYGNIEPIKDIGRFLDYNDRPELIDKCLKNKREFKSDYRNTYLNTTNILEWDLGWFSDTYVSQYQFLFNSISKFNKSLFVNLSKVYAPIKLGYLKDVQTLKYIS